MYKLFMLVVRYLPIITAAAYALRTIAAWFYVDMGPISHVFGMSLMPWLLCYLGAFVFRFCIYHRVFLWYIAFDNTINALDRSIHIPLDDLAWLSVNTVAICVTLLIILFIHMKRNGLNFFIKKHVDADDTNMIDHG